MTSSDKIENHSSVFPLQDWIHIHLYTCGSYILTAVSRLTVSCVKNQQTLQSKDDLNCLVCLDLYPAAFETHIFEFHKSNVLYTDMFSKQWTVTCTCKTFLQKLAKMSTVYILLPIPSMDGIPGKFRFVLFLSLHKE